MMQRIIIPLLLLLLVAACDGGSCVKADDFGSPTIPFEVNGSSMGTLPKFPDNPELGWYRKAWASGTGYVLTGDAPLKMTIEGAWSTWKAQDGLDTDGYDSDDNPVDNWCGHESFSEFDDGENTGIVFDESGTTVDPCFFIEGIGFYIGFSRNQELDVADLYHVAADEYFSQDRNGWYFTMPLSDLEEIRSNLNVDYNSIKVYLLVLNYEYGDNINGCLAKDKDGRYIYDTSSDDFAVMQCSASPSVLFTSGVRSEKGGFLQFIVNIIVDPFENIVEGLYKNIVGNRLIRSLVTLFSTLFITYLGVVYFFGLVNYTAKDLMNLVLKFGIVYMFLSPTGGWAMYKYFVEFFWGGSQDLASFVAGAISEGAAKVQSSVRIDNMSVSSSIMTPLDQIIESFTSNAVQRKMVALIFSHPLGIVFYITMMFCMFVFIMSSVQVAVVVITVYIIMSVLLSLGPIFLIALLLPYSRKYFDSWLKQLFAAMLQPMLLLTFITFFATIIYDYMKRLLYYEACFKTILPLVFFDIGWWTNDGHEVFIYDDNNNEFVEGKLDDLLNFNNLFIFAIFSVLLTYMVEKVPGICDQLAGGLNFSGFSAQTRSMLSKAQTGIQTAGGKAAYHFVGKPLRNAGVALAGRTPIATFVKGTKEYDLRMAKSELRKDYLAKGFKDDEIQKILMAPKDRPSQIGSAELENRYMDRRASSELKYGKGNISVPGYNGLKRMYRDGLKGNFYRGKKAVTDSYTSASQKQGRNYANWRNNQIAQKRREGSAYDYKQLKQYSPAYSKVVNDKDFRLDRKKEMRAAMDKKVNKDFKNVTKGIDKNGLSADEIKDNLMKRGATQAEASEAALKSVRYLETEVANRLEKRGYTKASAKAISQKKLAEASRDYSKKKASKSSK